MDHAATQPLPRQSGAPRARSPYAITYALIGINVLVFAAMVASGVSFTQPTPLDVANWGGDFGPLTIGAHQWWRLLTSCFLHFGIIHIGFNMYVLFQIGPFIERAFGRARYLLIYFFAGLGGSLVSVWVLRTRSAQGPRAPSSACTARCSVFFSEIDGRSIQQ